MSQVQRRGIAAEIGRFLRANISSTIATALDWALVTALTWAGTHYLVSAAVGAGGGAATDFLLKRCWAFDRAAKDGAAIEGIRYLAVSGASLGWNLLVAYVLVDGLKLPAVPGVIAASVVVGFAWNYPLHRFFVFRHASELSHLQPKVESESQACVAVGERRP